jgi:DmsE family decaheme c-type cytochrome
MFTAQASLASSRLARDRLCLSCHDEMEAKPILALYQTRHGVVADPRTPACQDCHGASLEHAREGKLIGRRPATDLPFPPRTGSLDSDTARRQSAPCLNCHENNTARHWWGSSHENRGLACTACHTLHTPRDRLLERSAQAETCYGCHPQVRAETRRPHAHPIATGQMTCGDCHDPHGGEGPRLTRPAALNDTCHECHADKRGPFLWEHAPVNDNCLHCHTPHGGNHAKLLKARQPWLCQECHSSTRHPSVAYSGLQIPGGGGSLAVQIPLRGCANCHSRVHGSNHPSGARLLR